MSIMICHFKCASKKHSAFKSLWSDILLCISKKVCVLAMVRTIGFYERPLSGWTPSCGMSSHCNYIWDLWSPGHQGIYTIDCSSPKTDSISRPTVPEPAPLIAFKDFGGINLDHSRTTPAVANSTLRIAPATNDDLISVPVALPRDGVQRKVDVIAGFGRERCSRSVLKPHPASVKLVIVWCSKPRTAPLSEITCKENYISTTSYCHTIFQYHISR